MPARVDLVETTCSPERISRTDLVETAIALERISRTDLGETARAPERISSKTALLLLREEIQLHQQVKGL